MRHERPERGDLHGGGAAEDAALLPAQGAFPSIWFFIAGDCFSFGIFFAVFMSERTHAVALFNAGSRMLDVRLGLLNTLILITSSYLVALAAEAARRGAMAAVRLRLAGAVLVGAGFAVTKLFEYTAKISHGITPMTNEFFGYYFVLTGVHFLHYLIGMVVLVVLIRKSLRRTSADASYLNWIESGGIYWHMVDLLWVFLFPMLYLLGAR